MEYKDLLLNRFIELVDDTDMMNYYQDSVDNLLKFTEEDIAKLFRFDREMSASFDKFLVECFRSKIICDTYKDTVSVIEPYTTPKELAFVNKSEQLRKLMAHIAEYFMSIGIDQSIAYNYYESYMKVHKESRCITRALKKLDINKLGICKEYYRMTRSLMEVGKREDNVELTKDYMDNLATFSSFGYFGAFFNVLNEYYMIKLGVDNNYGDLDSLTRLVAIIKISPVEKSLKKYLGNRIDELARAYSCTSLLIERLVDDLTYTR